MPKLKVQGNSMLPTILSGDEVEITRTKNIKKNNIITFKYKNKIILHRVKKINKNNIITQGDNEQRKQLITKNDIIGIMTKNLTTNKKPTTNPIKICIYKTTNSIAKTATKNKTLKKIISKSKTKRSTIFHKILTLFM